MQNKLERYRNRRNPKIKLDNLQTLIFTEGMPIFKTSEGKDIFLVIGNLGAGKSTTVSYFMGNEMEEKNDDGSQVGVKESSMSKKGSHELPVIGHSLTFSKTLYPHSYDTLDRITLCDCPGFQANRPLEEKVCEPIGIELAVKLANSIRGVLIVIDYHEFRTGRGLCFRSMVDTLSKLFGSNLEEAYKSLFFIITKKPRYSKCEDVKKNLLTAISSSIEEREEEIKRSNSSFSEDDDSGDDIDDNDNDNDNDATISSAVGLEEIAHLQFLKLLEEHQDHLMVIDVLDHGPSWHKVRDAIIKLPPISKNLFDFKKYDDMRIHFNQMIYGIIDSFTKEMKNHHACISQLTACKTQEKDHTDKINLYEKQIGLVEDGFDDSEFEQQQKALNDKMDKNHRAIDVHKEKIKILDKQDEETNKKIQLIDNEIPVKYWEDSIFEKRHAVFGFMSWTKKHFNYNGVAIAEKITNISEYSILLVGSNETVNQIPEKTIILQSKNDKISVFFLNKDNAIEEKAIIGDSLLKQLSFPKVGEKVVKMKWNGNEDLFNTASSICNYAHVRNGKLYGEKMDEKKGTYTATYKSDFAVDGDAKIEIRVQSKLEPGNVKRISELKKDLERNATERDLLLQQIKDLESATQKLQSLFTELSVKAKQGEEQALEQIKKYTEELNKVKESLVKTKQQIKQYADELAATKQRIEAKRTILQSVEKIVSFISFDSPLVAAFLEELKKYRASAHFHLMNDLHVAVLDNSLELVKHYSRQEILLNAKDDNGDTPLHLAIKNHFVQTALILVLEGAEINGENNDHKSPLDLLFEYDESKFTADERNLLALMLYRAPCNLQEKGFSDEFVSKVLKLRDRLILMHRPFRKSIESVVADSVLSDGRSTFDKSVHKVAFREMLAFAELRPLLDIIVFAVSGYHDLAEKGNERRPLCIIIDPIKANVDILSLGDATGAYGVYYNRKNRIYLGGQRAENSDKSKSLTRGTLIHEVNHFVANEVFRNDCKPYKGNDKKNEEAFELICNEIESRKDSLHDRLSSVFNYPKSQWHAELIVRVTQLIAMDNNYKTVEKQCPALLKYYQDVFLPACQKHLYDLRHKNKIFKLSLLQNTKSAILDLEEDKLAARKLSEGRSNVLGVLPVSNEEQSSGNTFHQSPLVRGRAAPTNTAATNLVVINTNDAVIDPNIPANKPGS